VAASSQPLLTLYLLHPDCACLVLRSLGIEHLPIPRQRAAKNQKS